MSPTAPDHFVIATTGPYGHMPPLLGVAIALAEADRDIHVSLILHTNNTQAAERLLASTSEVKDRIKLYPTGTPSALKDVRKSYSDMLMYGGEQYEAILTDSTRPPPSVFCFDISSFFYIDLKTAVEKKFPQIKPLKLVGYDAWPLSHMLFLLGAEEDGSDRWLRRVLKENRHNRHKFPTSAEGFAGLQTRLPETAEDAKKMEKVLSGSDLLINVPGVPPFHMYEYWAVPMDWTKFQNEGWIQWLEGMQAVTHLLDAWICCFPSEIFEPEAYEAARKDHLITAGGEKPLYQLDWHEFPPQALQEDVKAFLDKQAPKSVVFVSFGTMLDAGEGVINLFEELVESHTPFVMAGGNHFESLPERTRQVIESAVAHNQAIAPGWCDQVAVLNHPSVLCFVSHCGTNSVVEAFLAEVPILTWTRQGDHSLIASQIGVRGVGVELVQYHQGHQVGRPVAHLGRIVEGDPQAIRAEVRDAMNRVKGPEGEGIRDNLRKLAEDIRVRRKGVWRENVRQFIDWTRGSV